MMRRAFGSSKPLSNPCLILFGFFNLMLADTNHGTAAAAAQHSDMNSHRCFIRPPGCGSGGLPTTELPSCMRFVAAGAGRESDRELRSFPRRRLRADALSRRETSFTKVGKEQPLERPLERLGELLLLYDRATSSTQCRLHP